MATFKQYKKKNGSIAWQFKSYLGIDPISKKQITTTRRGFKTKKAAMLAESQLKLNFEEHGLQDKKDTILYKEIYGLWVTSYRNTVKESTLIDTEQKFRTHILPIFGNLEIDKISILQCQKAVDHWASKMQSFSAVVQYASKIVDYGIHLEVADKNPFKAVIRPKKQKGNRKIKFYTIEELQLFLNYLDDQVAKYRERDYSCRKYCAEFNQTLFRLLAFTGLRINEALALNIDDIDFSSKTLSVNKTLSKTKKGMQLDTTKTQLSTRKISVDDKTLHLIKRWNIRHQQMLLTTGVRPGNFLFPTIHGKAEDYIKIKNRSNKIATKLGLHPISSHGFRHTHASMLFEAGATTKEAQERLGHSSIEMTMNVYTHVTEKTKEKTVEKLMQFANF